MSHQLETCPDCGAHLPALGPEAATHRYVGASASCWGLFSVFINGGEPPMAMGELTPLIFDAYLAQHHGTPSPQATQSVAVHALVLYGILERGRPLSDALTIRTRVLRPLPTPKHERFAWLTPPSYAGGPTLADVAAQSNPRARATHGDAFVRHIWSCLRSTHFATLKRWFDEYA